MIQRQPVNKVRWCGIVASRDDARPLLQKAGDVVLVERGVPRSAILKCPCGCGEDLVLNLDRRLGRAWRLYRDRRGLTLYPSVWRESGCRSHFILWHDDIFMCNTRWESVELGDVSLENRILLK